MGFQKEKEEGENDGLGPLFGEVGAVVVSPEKSFRGWE